MSALTQMSAPLIKRRVKHAVAINKRPGPLSSIYGTLTQVDIYCTHSHLLFLSVTLNTRNSSAVMMPMVARDTIVENSQDDTNTWMGMTIMASLGTRPPSDTEWYYRYTTDHLTYYTPEVRI